MIKAAADLIKTDIKSKDISKSFYPLPGEISSVDENCAFLPETLYLFLRTIFNEKSAERKIASIGQAIIQAPLQIGLPVQMHHHYGSKFLIDSLTSHGFCSSYTEVKKFEMSAAQTKGTDIPGLTPGHFVQYEADNVDHNQCLYVGRTEHFSWYGDNSCRYFGQASRFSNTEVFHHGCRDSKYWKD